MGRGPARTVAIAALAAVLFGASLVAQRDPAPTLQELEAAARRDSLDPETLYRLALRYDVIKRYDDAGRVARQVVAVDLRYAPA